MRSQFENIWGHCPTSKSMLSHSATQKWVYTSTNTRRSQTHRPQIQRWVHQNWNSPFHSLGSPSVQLALRVSCANLLSSHLHRHCSHGAWAIEHCTELPSALTPVILAVWVPVSALITITTTVLASVVVVIVAIVTIMALIALVALVAVVCGGSAVAASARTTLTVIVVAWLRRERLVAAAVLALSLITLREFLRRVTVLRGTFRRRGRLVTTAQLMLCWVDVIEQLREHLLSRL